MTGVLFFYFSEASHYKITNIYVMFSLEGGEVILSKISAILTVFISLIVLGGCRSGTDNEGVLLKEAEISVLEESNYFTSKPQDELLNQVFLLAANNKQYVVFYMMNINEASIAYHVKGYILEIKIETNPSIDEKTYIYELINPKGESYDTISFIKDGEETPVSTYVIN